MLYKTSTVLLVTVLLASVHTVAAPDPNNPVALDKPLFSSQDTLNLTLSLDFDAMCRPNEVEDCQYAPATLNYTSQAGVEYKIPIEARVRGGWRARKDNCQVPPVVFTLLPGRGGGHAVFRTGHVATYNTLSNQESLWA